MSCDMHSWWCQFYHQLAFLGPLAIFAVLMIWLAVKDIDKDKG